MKVVLLYVPSAPTHVISSPSQPYIPPPSRNHYHSFYSHPNPWVHKIIRRGERADIAWHKYIVGRLEIETRDRVSALVSSILRTGTGLKWNYALGTLHYVKGYGLGLRKMDVMLAEMELMSPPFQIIISGTL